MKFPFAKIFKSQSKQIPGTVKKQLEKCFPGSKNIDWEIKNNIFEAIFYLTDVEHIAKFTKEGTLIEFKKNLWLNELPEQINNSGHIFGEIMNGIVINRNNVLFYELIIRDSKLDRYVYLFDDKGTLKESRLL
ncbi:MAG: hypothetical protein FD181_3759 [Prolixibacteraceae bacterium]|nr:MAG: hypothetical protein FD181_3759 [Prolixibacteraceae bacterium]